MTQTVPATCVLGPGKTGLTIGLRVLNLDGTTYAAFSAVGVAETSVLGTYRKADGVVCPLAGGYIVWGTALVDYAEATVESTSANVTFWKDATAPAMTGDAYARLGAPAGASVSADIAAIAADVSALAGSGAITHTITVDDGTNPIDGVEVWITTDSAGSNVVAGTLTTDTLGQVEFLLDAGSYYAWMQRAGYNFTNPTAITVA